MSQIGNLNIDPSSPFFILGPCALEMEDFAWQMARSLKEIATRTGIQFIFKASYDKANRTSVDSFRGPGVVEGCRILGEIGKELGIPVNTHSTARFLYRVCCSVVPANPLSTIMVFMVKP